MIEPSLSNFVVYGVQILIVVIAAEACLRLTRLLEPRMRLVYWRAVIAACFVLPLVANAPPPMIDTPAQAVASTSAITTVPTETLPPPHGPTFGDLLVWTIALGIGLRTLWLAGGLVRLRRLRILSEPVTLEQSLETLRQRLAPHAAIRSHESVLQPVTFGTWRPVVFVPPTFDAATAEAQRAVVCHELLHVRRCDWMWMMLEEAVRTLFWFHPAIRWALNQVQLSREELVDSLAIAVTGEKREYMQALLAFANRPAPAPATLFARRRHLAVRIRRIAEEVAMSRLRLAVIGVLLIGALVAAIGFVGVTIPLRAQAQSTVREPQQALNALRAGINVGQPLQIKRVAPVYPERARAAGVGGMVLVDLRIGTDGSVVNAEPRVSTLSSPDGDRRSLANASLQEKQGIEDMLRAAADAVRQWQYEPTLLNGVPHEVLLTTTVAFAVLPPPPPPPPAAPAPQQSVIGQVPGSATPGQVPAGSIPPPPPPAPRPGFSPIRIGGSLREPKQLGFVPPVFPEAALTARVSGTVVLEVLINREGSVTETRVLRSIPLLDDAAAAAVRQWKYQPTLLNGVPVELLMPVAVPFTLP